MLILLAAATVASGPTMRTPNLFQSPENCRDAPYHVVDRYGRPPPDRLGELPRGGLILAVDRSVNGCRVITVLRGEVRPDQPNPPADQYRYLPLRPVAPR